MARLVRWLFVGATLAAVSSQAVARPAAAALKGDAAQYFAPDDYPPEAMRLRQEGRVVAKLWVDETGRVVSCTPTRSSGSPALDQRTCEIALTRIVYEPARNAKGRPMASSVELPVRWVLPSAADEASRYLPVAPSAIVTEQVIDADGQRRSCVLRANGKDIGAPCSNPEAEAEDVLRKVPADFRGHPLVVYSESLQDYSGASPSMRLDESELTVLTRVTIRFTITADGQVTNCKIEGIDHSEVLLRTMPCSGAPPFRDRLGKALTQPVEGTWTVIQAVRLLPREGGV